MRASDLSPNPGSVHKKKRIGRGNASGHGTSATRGTKGQQSRTGYSKRLGFEGGQNPLIRALSRKRGFNNHFRVEYEPINVAELAKFPAGTSITTASLRAAGVVKSARMPVKILGNGDIEVALTVEAERFSATARSKIEAAGGTVVELNARGDSDAERDAAAASASGSARRATRTAAKVEATPAAAEARNRAAKAPAAEAEPEAEEAEAESDSESEPEKEA
jgi:large subunit ribosomal protein L15